MKAELGNRSKLLYQKDYDPVTFDVLKVRPEDIASQITLIDLPLFKAVTFEELSGGAWTKKSKHVDAPNIVAFTDRFNSICLWCQREILSHEKAAKRAEVLGHFIKIAKRLCDLNNLNSTFSIVSALQSLSVYRLTKTWSLLGRQERAVFNKLHLLFDNECNWERLREHLGSAKLPCIPYLGLYLTDLSFTDVAYGNARKNSSESWNKDQKKDGILCRIAHFQESFYGNLPYIECLQKYLQSIKFHEELLKFAEDDLFKLSLARESDAHHMAPSSPAVDFLRRASLSRTLRVISRLRPNLSAFETAAESLTPQLSSKRRSRHPIFSDHRRARSLGADWNTGEVNLLFPLDSDQTDSETFEGDSLIQSSMIASEKHLEDITNSTNSPRRIYPSSPLTPLKTSTPLRLTPKLLQKAPFCTPGNKSDADRLCLIEDDSKTPDYEGEVSVIVVRKRGSKPARMKCSRKCYLELRCSQLQQFWRRTVSVRCKTNRDTYHKKANKKMKLDECGWHVIRYINQSEPSFEMHHPSTGRIYRYLCKNETTAVEWYRHIRAAIQNALPRTPSNLITFD